MVVAYVKDRSGRTDCATGAVPLGNLKGEALANALMKAETKAKRRATLSICGLGLLDETEVGSIPGAVVEDPEAAEGRTFGRRAPEPTPPVQTATALVADQAARAQAAVAVLEDDLPPRNAASLPDEPVPEGEKAGVTALFKQARRELRLSRAQVLALLKAESVEASLKEYGYPANGRGLQQLYDLLAFKVDQAQARGGLPESEPAEADAQQVAF